MPTEPNAVCAVCGTKYNLCLSCKKRKGPKSWRAVTDTAGCYKIYIAIHNYTTGKISKEKAGEMLKNCNIPSGLQDHIRAAIDEITGSNS